MHAKRSFALVLGLAAAGLLAFLLARSGPSAPWLPGCLFHRLTGLDCPGCGMTRAAYATLHGRFWEAFRFNPVGMVLFPAALLGIGLELIGWVRGNALPLGFRVSGIWGWVIVGVLLVFWIARNIPGWPGPH